MRSIDISRQGDRGLCFELHTRLQALCTDIEKSDAMNSYMARVGLGNESRAVFERFRPNVQWVRLVINGQRVGLQ